ncbi:MAG: arylsulfatase [Verrucomicrobia bacterium]|nr:arylsulfatase [Verrucomicrobiota bacterium]
MIHRRFLAPFLALLATAVSLAAADRARPRNVVIIYADDLGYGDVSCYGAKRVSTPNIDRLAKEGLRFTSGYATSGTCTPSRFALMSGEYPWRRDGTGVLPGDAALVVDLTRVTLPTVFKRAGYTTGAVGKWHLGLGTAMEQIDWNQPVGPGPREVGFDYSFIMAATADRVPCVYLEDQRVVGLDPKDPLRVNYKEPFPGEPTGVSDRAKLKLDWSHGHNMGVVNGIGRIGYYTGGKAAQWVDEDMADTFTRQAVAFITREKDRPFFLYFAPHDIHVPRVPNPRFVGKTQMGARGDAIVQLDWEVGEVLATLERHGLAKDTLVILSSDNGPVIDDGYKDAAVERLGEHRPAGPMRGGKYSRFEGGTRVPFIVRWPAQVKPGVSDALVSHIDFVATFAAMTGQRLAEKDAPDSLDHTAALLGQSPRGRDYVIEHAGRLALREGKWKYIVPAPQGVAVQKNTNTETANLPSPQLYDLTTDIGETKNLAAAEPARVAAMAEKLTALQKAGRTRP